MLCTWSLVWIQAFVQGAFLWQDGFFFPSCADSQGSYFTDWNVSLCPVSAVKQTGEIRLRFPLRRIGYSWHNAWDHWVSLNLEFSPPCELAVVIFEVEQETKLLLRYGYRVLLLAVGVCFSKSFVVLHSFHSFSRSCSTFHLSAVCMQCK